MMIDSNTGCGEQEQYCSWHKNVPLIWQYCGLSLVRVCALCESISKQQRLGDNRRRDVSRKTNECG